MFWHFHEEVSVLRNTLNAQIGRWNHMLSSSLGEVSVQLMQLLSYSDGVCPSL